MFILILMLVVNLMQNLKYVFFILLTMMMRNLVIGFEMNKTEKLSEVEMCYLMNRLCTMTDQL